MVKNVTGYDMCKLYAGSFGTLAHMYLGAGAGFVVRWTYWAIQVIAVGGEVLAIGIYTQYWWPNLPLWLPVAIFSVALLVINAITVSMFGEIEYWFSMVKVVAIAASQRGPDPRASSRRY